MSINKQALLRYKTLDKCFGNKYKKYFIEDLIEACKVVLQEENGSHASISRRQIFEDIKFMKSEVGYKAPIESLKAGKKTYYRYSDKDFSIEKSPINKEELQALENTLDIVSRLQGLDNMDWMAELYTKLQGLVQPINKTIIEYDANPYLKGLEHLSPLYNYIKHESIVAIDYKPFQSEKAETFILHPYYLKQYNTRWFLFGWNTAYEAISTLALDRIQSIAIANNTANALSPFQKNTIDFEAYFEDIIGVSVEKDVPIYTVKMRLDNSIIPYIAAKPLHGSQKVNGNILSLSVKLNYELESLILSYGEKIEVLEPLILVEKLKNRIAKMHNFYMCR